MIIFIVLWSNDTTLLIGKSSTSKSEVVLYYDVHLETIFDIFLARSLLQGGRLKSTIQKRTNKLTKRLLVMEWVDPPFCGGHWIRKYDLLNRCYAIIFYGWKMRTGMKKRVTRWKTTDSLKILNIYTEMWLLFFSFMHYSWYGPFDWNRTRDCPQFGWTIETNNMERNRRVRSGYCDRCLLWIRFRKKYVWCKEVSKRFCKASKQPRRNSVCGKWRSIFCPTQSEIIDGCCHYGALCLQRKRRACPVSSGQRSTIFIESYWQLSSDEVLMNTVWKTSEKLTRFPS